MSTVPKADTPPPANNAKTTLVSDAGSHGYRRPTAGGNAQGGTIEGGSSSAPAGPTPDYSISMSGGPVSAGGTQTAGVVFNGATLVVAQPDATGHPKGDTSGGGTVGDSGPQGAGPGPTPGQ